MNSPHQQACSNNPPLHEQNSQQANSQSPYVFHFLDASLLSQGIHHQRQERTQISREVIEQLMWSCSQKEAAEVLGINVSSLKRHFYTFHLGKWPPKKLRRQHQLEKQHQKQHQKQRVHLEGGGPNLVAEQINRSSRFSEGSQESTSGNHSPNKQGLLTLSCPTTSLTSSSHPHPSQLTRIAPSSDKMAISYLLNSQSLNWRDDPSLRLSLPNTPREVASQEWSPSILGAT
mmetsp:Transcript_1755/g.6201  ORF Transcript_1755/g.6201 Transcript_1755/m.6201 type:complete len:231 (+) Transcript_1755:131-823(+)